MRITSRVIFRAKTSAAILGVGLTMAVAQPASAQTAACVNLLVGSGYSAWMGVKFANSFYWSESFPIGQSRCIRLPVEGMVDGAPYEVVVSAALGSSKVPCTPNPGNYTSANKNSVTYNAWGTTLNVKCEMPHPDNLNEINNLPIKPTAEGQKVLEMHKTEGSKPAPTE